ncbi:MAG: DUF3987 domain-containing protein [Deltaproteobacteria bacterium]|jgi:hypothetical protein|nr:DUF3987 domain-containing protein [Deltaproteobacteria bacterium]
MQKKHNILHPPKQVAFEQLFRLFFKEGEVTKIRALGLTGKSPFWDGWARGTVSGYFDNPAKFASKAQQLNNLRKSCRQDAEGIYFVLNPVKPALLARANNGLKTPKSTTQDDHVVCHRWFIIDIDPKRPSGISASKEEIEHALKSSNEIVSYLSSKGWPDPIRAFSGNGYHALFRLPDLSNIKEITDLKKVCLQALSTKFSNDNVDIDTKVFNPSRIIKLYGTWARKGDHTDDRPHRLSYIDTVPEPLQVVSLEQLQELSTLTPQKEVQPHKQTDHSYNTLGKVNVQAYLDCYGIEIAKAKHESGRTIYGLKHCVFNSEHTDNDASIVQLADGKLLYQCFHNSCQGRTWRDARTEISGNDSLAQFCDGYDPGGSNKYEPAGVKLTDESENKEPDEWDKARELFPRLPFPWEVLPSEIVESLQQLARSHATSPLSLPGAAMAIFSSVLGAIVNVSPKESWREPLIFWFADIRPSGSGKTPATRALCSVLYHAQKQADKVYKQRIEEERAKRKKDQRPVPRAKSYFITDLTLEGLRADVTGHGGTVCVLDELSSFITGQNQYKSKGNDREAWIILHTGAPARVTRAKESYTISGSRISIVGGIQPAVWQVSFGGEKGLFISDGTVFRFLATYEGDQFYKLTKESWSDENREVWEQALTRAMEWSDKLIASEDWKPKTICMTEDARELFFDWRNKLQKVKPELPDQLRGYLPKITGYSLRLAGVLYCMKHFVTGSSPGLILEREDMQKGIDAATFYAGHIVDAAQSLCSNKQIVPFEITDQVKHLAKTLESLRNEVDNGHLAVGYIQERFNEELKPEQKIKSPHAMGSFLRKSNMTIPEGHFRANKRIKVKCLLWDKKTDSFLKQVHKVLFVRNTINHAGLEARTLKNQSPQSPQNITEGKKTEDIEDIEKPKSSPVSFRATNDVDNEDIEDIVSKENKKTELIPVEKWVNKSLPDDVEATRTRDAILI